MNKIAIIINAAIQEYSALKECYRPDVDKLTEGEYIIKILENNNFAIKPCPAPGTIEKALCDVYDMQFDEILNKRRYFAIVEPRHVGMFFNVIVKLKTKLSLDSIGAIYHKDHASADYGYKKIVRLINLPNEKELKNKVEKISQLTGISYKHLLECPEK
ncbi:MAG: helix-turn-helix domain-containing protein [Paludibacter sp.]|nr:helix-turn-helix domain-containing protein [Paludibacter sp.]